MTTLSRKEYIHRIEHLPEDLADAVSGLMDEQLDTPYRSGGWTLRQVVHHLADSHMHAYIRMKLAFTEHHPTLKPYDQNAWAELADASEFPIEASILIIKGLHARWAAFLKSIPETDWTRTAFHPENGDMKLETFLEYYATHGQHHVEQIRKLRREKGW
jgi:uncharacterized damage-inducible protein DinB